MGFGRVVAIGTVGIAALASPAAADNIALYQCADGSQFALAFYEADNFLPYHFKFFACTHSLITSQPAGFHNNQLTVDFAIMPSSNLKVVDLPP